MCFMQIRLIKLISADVAARPRRARLPPAIRWFSFWIRLVLHANAPICRTWLWFAHSIRSQEVHARCGEI